MPTPPADYEGSAGDLPSAATDFEGVAGGLPGAATDSEGAGQAGCACCTGGAVCCLSQFATTCFFLKATPAVLLTVPDDGIVLTSPLGFANFHVVYYSMEHATDPATGQDACMLVVIEFVGTCLSGGDIRIDGKVSRWKSHPYRPGGAGNCWFLDHSFNDAELQEDTFAITVPAPADCGAPVFVGPFSIPAITVTEPATGSVWTFDGFDLDFAYDRSTVDSPGCELTASEYLPEGTGTLYGASRPIGVWAGGNGHTAPDNNPQLLLYINCCAGPPPPPPTWNCADGGCVDPLDGMGFYNDTNGGLASCLAACTGVLGDSGDGGDRGGVTGLACCPGKTLPLTVSAAVLNIANCPCLEGIYGLVWSNGAKAWLGNGISCGGFVQLALYCLGGQYVFEIRLNGVLAARVGPTEPGLPCCPMSMLLVAHIDPGFGPCNTGAVLNVSLTGSGEHCDDTEPGGGGGGGGGGAGGGG